MFRALFLSGLIVAAACRAQTPVILISIDTLRADHLSSYGYRRIHTPNIDSFAEHGTLFGAADAQIPLTLPSHTSLFTSTYPFENGVEENAERVPAGAVTLAAVLKSHGYRTAAFIGSVFLERQLGLDGGFDLYDSPFSFEAFSRVSGSMFFGDTRQTQGVREKRDGALVLRAASQWLAANRGQPVFAFIHLFDLHKPYDPHRGLPASYDGELAYIDQVLSTFKKSLVNGGWWDRSLVILLSDHGESLGEHGESSHGYFIYESTMWVPLLFHWPAGAPTQAARVDRPAGLIDVAPTVLDFLHIPAPPSFEGKSLLQTSNAGIYGESVHTHDAFGWAPLRSMRVGNYKYIEAPKPELYDLAKDPHELNNLVRSQPKQAAALQVQLKKLIAPYGARRTSVPGDVTRETRSLLGSLGYVAAGPRASLAASGPDPKDRLPEFRMYEKAQTALYYGRVDEAIATLGELLARDPHNTLARRDLGDAYLTRGQDAKARPCFEEVLKVAPDDYMTQFELGLVDEHLGLFQEAIGHLQAACTIAPAAAQCKRELDAVKQKVK